MPWIATDAKRHTKKASSGVAQRQWAHVANAVLESGGSEGSAVRQANGVVGRRGSGGSYQEGTDYVPETGPYTLHEGEMVLPADEAKQLRRLRATSLLTGQPAGGAEWDRANERLAGTSLAGTKPSPAPVSQPDAAGWRHAVHPGAEAAVTRPTIPATRLTPGEAPDIGAAMPGAPAASAPMGAGGMPPTSLVQAQPSLPGPPKREDYPAQQLPMWRKALGLLAATAAGPRMAGPLAENILRGPEQRAEQKFEKATGDYNAEVARGRQERGDILNRENVESEIAERQARTAQAEAATQAAANKPEHQDIVKEFSDALVEGDQAKIDALQPRVKQFIETTKPPKEAAPRVQDEEISDYLQARGLQDTPKNRDSARVAIGQRKKPEVDSSDAEAIADSIIAGNQPPDLKGLYRNNAPVRAALARKGFNLVKAEEDWQATQKYMATLNGSQQTRLRQAVESTKGYLDQVEDIYGQWQKVGKTSEWKAFNKASLATAKQLPGEAGNLANRLEARIADLTSDLGTVYKGGNSSTDESLKLAARNLSADWNEKTFKDAVKDIRESIRIRENSMKNLGAAGVSTGNAYTPPATGGGSPFEQWKANQKP